MNFAECSAYQVRPTQAQPWVPPIPPIGERWVPGAPSLSGRPSRGLERDTITVGVGASLGWASAWSALPGASTMTLSRIARFAIPHACALWLLAVSILLSFDPPQVLVYVDSQDDVGGVVDTRTPRRVRISAQKGCPYPFRSRSAGSVRRERASATCLIPDVASLDSSRSAPNRRQSPQIPDRPLRSPGLLVSEPGRRASIFVTTHGPPSVLRDERLDGHAGRHLQASGADTQDTGGGVP